jgi:hypothetical protein
VRWKFSSSEIPRRVLRERVEAEEGLDCTSQGGGYYKVGGHGTLSRRKWRVQGQEYRMGTHREKLSSFFLINVQFEGREI